MSAPICPQTAGFAERASLNFCGQHHHKPHYKLSAHTIDIRNTIYLSLNACAHLHTKQLLPKPITNMATTQQQILTPEQRLAQENAARNSRIIRNVAIGGVIICPIIALLPPRKLDLYTFSLGVGFYLSADHLCEARYGRGLVTQLSPWRAVGDLPTDRAREVQAQLRAARDEERKKLGKGGDREDEGVLKKIWMGGETEGWKERRLEEEKKALEEGKSYTDMIYEQVWDVWNWDKKGKGRRGDGEGKE